MTAAAPASGTVRVATQAMGTWFAITAEDGDSRRARAAADLAVELIEELHGTLTRFESSSLLAHLGRIAPRAAPVDRDIIELLLDARALGAATSGAFSPIIAGGWDDITIDPDRGTVAVADPAVSLDFGAIAKGHAVDRAVAVLRDAGVARGFVHGGTSSGAGFGDPPWRVGLGGPKSLVIELADQAYAVSATVQRTDGGASIHLIDRRSGAPVAVDRRVAVVGPCARRADGWSTVIAILGFVPPSFDAGSRAWVASGPGPWNEVSRR
ncbi:MAG: FAD:protein FMN transferase [Gemmatimonadetes bacterium]|nr:FAD:protein FMN transferase [Gemmatimonadota bacterium]